MLLPELLFPWLLQDPLIITASTTLDPRRSYGPLVIQADGVVLDGGGAQILGPIEPSSNQYVGAAVAAQGVPKVTLRNLRVRGFERGLEVVGGRGWTIEDCDFSDHDHDPEFDRGENGRRGGLVFLRCRNPNNPSWQDVNPVITSYETADVARRLVPRRDFLSRPRHNEGREVGTTSSCRWPATNIGRPRATRCRSCSGSPSASTPGAPRRCRSGSKA